MFGIKDRQPTAEEKKQIEDYKKIIFEGFKLSVKKKVPKEIAGLLVDEEFGSSVLREAKKEGLTFAMPVEKSGQDEFDFDYGDNFAKHIEEFDPTFVKVLVRYNPEGDAAMNKRQLATTKETQRLLSAEEESVPLRTNCSLNCSAAGKAWRIKREIRPRTSPQTHG